VGGYLKAAEHVLARKDWRAIDSWNFGPNPGEEYTVRQVVGVFQKAWDGSPKVDFAPPDQDAAALHKEAGLLRVDNTKAKVEMGWRPGLTNDGAIEAAVEWYKKVASGADARALTEAQIERIAGI
jgi:CDP-glucose 4,6-dehydratase